MRKYIKCISAFVTIALLLVGSLRLHPYYHLAKKQSMIKETMTNNSSDTLKIAFIGDSWAAYHHDYDKKMELLFDEKKRPAHVASLGNVGAKSREIYQRLYTTTKPILLECPNYCVISAGINDAVAKMGTDFYVHHYMLILQQLLELHIKPVVLEMPGVNYRATANREPWTMRMRHVLSSWMTGSELYGFESYKKALIKAIKKADLHGRIVYISADQWNPEGYRDHRNLYLPDEIHLNTEGYAVLDSCIASVILGDLRQNQ